MSQNTEHTAAGIITIMLIVVLVIFGGPLIDLISAGAPHRPGIEQYYWSYRALDIFAQAFLVFAASLAVAALFRREKDETTEGSRPGEDVI